MVFSWPNHFVEVLPQLASTLRQVSKLCLDFFLRVPVFHGVVYASETKTDVLPL